MEGPHQVPFCWTAITMENLRNGAYYEGIFDGWRMHTHDLRNVYHDIETWNYPNKQKENNMTREDFYHSKPMTFLQRLVSIGYSTCECCGMPLNFVSKHGGEHTIMISKYEGFFPVCKYC